jgi:hypothetical protein
MLLNNYLIPSLKASVNRRSILENHSKIRLPKKNIKNIDF